MIVMLVLPSSNRVTHPGFDKSRRVQTVHNHNSASLAEREVDEAFAAAVPQDNVDFCDQDDWGIRDAPHQFILARKAAVNNLGFVRCTCETLLTITKNHQFLILAKNCGGKGGLMAGGVSGVNDTT
jgi:hypothetical protein